MVFTGSPRKTVNSMKSFSTYYAIISNTRCLPATEISAGITLIQLEAIMLVPTHIKKRNTKWSFS
jgi:hypothetical protein